MTCCHSACVTVYLPSQKLWVNRTSTCFSLSNRPSSSSGLPITNSPGKISTIGMSIEFLQSLQAAYEDTLVEVAPKPLPNGHSSTMAARER